MNRVQEGVIWLAVVLLAGCVATAPIVENTEDVSRPTIREPVAPIATKTDVAEEKDVAVIVQTPPLPSAVPPTPMPVSPAPLPVTPPVSSEDHDLFFEGIALLNPSNQSEPAQARAVFALLAERYPQSRWRSVAETVVRLIDEGEAARRGGLQDHLLRERIEAERSRTLHENEQLKRTVRELTEKLQTATASLTQENEQLKKDLQRLKNLEIELEKRERMLR